MDHFEQLIGDSPNFESLLRNAQLVAATDVTVLITGETGTGKELLANAIQQSSRRAERPFITLNCAALPETLAESELFGHSKGAFTGATTSKSGKLIAADGGTLFLDEVDSLSLPIQAKLLRFLESGECQPVGETRSRKVDVRVIAASNANLAEQVKAGDFRKDLYFRLNVVPMNLPALRERGKDIERLLGFFTRQFANDHQLAPIQFSTRALQHLGNYSWPGNIRELRNLCERLSILLAGQTIDIGNLPAELNSPAEFSEPSGWTLPDSGINLENLEIDLIRQALSRTRGNRSQSARLLGISRDTLLYRIQKYGITA